MTLRLFWGQTHFQFVGTAQRDARRTHSKGRGGVRPVRAKELLTPSPSPYFFPAL